MAFLTAQQLENVANQLFDFYTKNEILDQSIQDKPLLKAMKANAKEFPGGKELIHGNVKFEHSVSFQGYEGDDIVEYVNPSNVKQYSYPWKELHGGISVTHSELKKAGITVVDSAMGDNLSNNSKQDVIQITNLFEDKLQDMNEGLMESLNEMYWLDGTQDAKAFPGVLSILTDTPTTGIVGGLDSASVALWRHRALVGSDHIAPSAANQTLSRTLRQEIRQLRRYGGRPSLLLCGSTFLKALDLEIEAKGSYTESGFARKETTDIMMADFSMRGVGTFQYDPTLDDLDRADYCYFIDERHLFPRVMSGQDMKKHTPARPANQYVLNRSVTHTLGLICDMRNAHGVYKVNYS